MPAWPKLRAPMRLTPRFAVGVAVALLLAGVAMAVANESQVRGQKLREATVQAEILAGSVSGALAFDDPATAAEYVNALRANRDVEVVGVYDTRDLLVAGSAAARARPPVVNTVRPPVFDGSSLTVTAPVLQGSSRLGSVYLRTIVEPLPRRAARYAAVGVLILMASLVIAVFGVSNASLAEAHRKLRVEMMERAKAEEALRLSQKAEAEAQLAIATERGRTALRQSEQQLELALRAGRLGNWALDLASGRMMASELFRENFGLGAHDAFDRYASLVARVHPEDRARQKRAMDVAIAKRTDLESEYRTITPDGETRWVLMRGRAAYDDDGQPIRMTGVSLDITARKKADEHQRLLLDELNHRVKNTLATVQSIALQSARDTDAVTFERAFLSRIAALARAHDLLTEVAWEGADLKEVIVRTLAPHAPEGQAERIHLSGPRVQLGPNAAVSLTMAFHELATNAAKYGSLSVSAGRVEVRWSADSLHDPAAVEIDWTESGGPEVSPPTRRGFGSRLVEKGLAREFDGQVELIFAPQGLRCCMRLPLSRKIQMAA
ncbi:PAS domain-containing protein [Phenylobacterium sp. LjRoot225]|uniref:sensor histidine kinase n=1 Tax=Phenylobacterium sp. LjRoot225 TaxID=3342285 RepID=UPI003ECE9E3A